VRALLDGARIRRARDARAVVWLAQVLGPTLVLAVRSGIALWQSDTPGLDMLSLERRLEELFERAPDREPEPENE
jgi:hypothetical protein